MTCSPLGSVLQRRGAHSDAVAVTVPILQMRKPTLREVKRHAQGHEGSTCCGQGLTLQFGLRAHSDPKGQLALHPRHQGRDRTVRRGLVYFSGFPTQQEAPRRQRRCVTPCHNHTARTEPDARRQTLSVRGVIDVTLSTSPRDFSLRFQNQDQLTAEPKPKTSPHEHGVLKVVCRCQFCPRASSTGNVMSSGGKWERRSHWTENDKQASTTARV